MGERTSKRKIGYIGQNTDHSIVIGNFGNCVFKAEGNFDLSGIIYNPKHTITFRIQGDGHLAFRGKCYRIIIAKMTGNCMLDLTGVVCNELQCDNIGEKATVITGRVRSISPAFLKDEATLQISEHPVVLNYSSTGKSRVIFSPLEISDFSSDN